MDRAASAPDSVWDVNGMATNLNALLAATAPMEPINTSKGTLTSRFADLFLDLDRIERTSPQVRSPQVVSARDHHHHNPNHRQNVTSAVLTPEYDRPATVQLNRQEFDRVKMTVKVLSDQVIEVHEVLRKLVPFLHQILSTQKTCEQQGGAEQAILEKLHPYIEQNMSNHLHNIQNRLLANMKTVVESQDNKFADINNQVQMLTAAVASREQDVVNNLGHLGELMNNQQTMYESKIEELRKEFSAKFKEFEKYQANSCYSSDS
eukprot:TRINITY_DN3142_c0_g2_i8.p2 TRINITY_DN3142_c0_g2~~TRINITY_DN3142_c0_g2_i8.p2  ORF type:complete len:263 (-),score=31.36 TRINITY_DN3142_c0_g2_i8:96-884(-)